MQASSETTKTAPKKAAAPAKTEEKVAAPAEVKAAAPVVAAPVVEKATEKPVVQQAAPEVVETVSVTDISTTVQNAAESVYNITKSLKTLVGGLSKEDLGKLQSSLKFLKKNFYNLENSYEDFLNSEVNVQRKKSSGARSEKKRAKKESSGGADEELKNSPVKTPQVVHEILLKFMNKPKDTLVSRAEALASINDFVRTHKHNENKEILVPGQNKRFNLIGSLKELFTDMKNIGMIESIPENIAYTDIMTYTSKFFPKKTAAKKTVV